MRTNPLALSHVERLSGALLALILALGCSCTIGAADNLQGPDGRVSVKFRVTEDGSPVYSIEQRTQTVLPESRLGLVRDDEDFSRGLKLIGSSRVERVKDKYEILTAKRRVNNYLANRKVYHLQTAAGKKMDLIFQVSNDGVAFRYHFPEFSAEMRRLKEEVTSFRFPASTVAWLQPMQVAKSGFEKSNPAYEEFYEREIPVSTPSTLGSGWVFPALFRNGNAWLLISETAMGRTYCGTRLRHESPGGEYRIGFPDPRETMNGEPVEPRSRLPWLTPWRIIVVGDLKTIAESTLGIDLAEKAVARVANTIKPGKSSWSWPLLGDANTKYDVQKRFIDYAADMGWAYCLIDADWDQKIGYEKAKELIDYAFSRKVGVLLWYNSAGDWNTVKYTPRDKMLTSESRMREFDRLKAMGVKGLKVDFFGGDGQAVMNYYQDILTDAARYGFLMNFHGATLPRGWQRTYPNLMTMEAIKGFEFVTFEQRNADQEPTHATIIPFTRNVFDPMDFTPVCLDKINRIQRRTTGAFELALAVLFTSGIQHYPEIPEGMAKMPDFVKNFMRQVPSVWDDTKYIDGYPGKLVVLARKGASQWYVAGINGAPVEKTLTLDLGALRGGKSGYLIADGTSQKFERQVVRLSADKKLTVTLKPHGGFVAVLK